MPNSDPRLPLNCPKCGVPVRYECTDGPVHVYRCIREGELWLHPDGRFGPPEKTKH